MFYALLQMLTSNNLFPSERRNRSTRLMPLSRGKLAANVALWRTGDELSCTSNNSEKSRLSWLL